MEKLVLRAEYGTINVFDNYKSKFIQVVKGILKVTDFFLLSERMFCWICTLHDFFLLNLWCCYYNCTIIVCKGMINICSYRNKFVSPVNFVSLIKLKNITKMVYQLSLSFNTCLNRGSSGFICKTGCSKYRANLLFTQFYLFKVIFYLKLYFIHKNLNVKKCFIAVVVDCFPLLYCVWC